MIWQRPGFTLQTCREWHMGATSGIRQCWQAVEGALLPPPPPPPTPLLAGGLRDHIPALNLTATTPVNAKCKA